MTPVEQLCVKTAHLFAIVMSSHLVAGGAGL